MVSSVTYVVSQWGRPTETFVRREVEAVRQLGVAVSVLSLKRPVAAGPSDRVVHLPPLVVVREGLLALASHPLSGMRTFFAAARGSTLRTAAFHMGAVAIGLAASRVLPARHVHAHFAWVAATTAWTLARAHSETYSVMAHAHDIYEERLLDRFLSQKLREAKFVAVESPAIADHVARAFGVDASVVRLGVPSAYLVDGLEARQPQPGLIVTVGSLVPKKGHDVLLRALDELPEMSLEIIGEGPERSRLERMVERSGLQERVRLRGALSEAEVREALDRAAVFALASRVSTTGDRDGVPNALIEAMARAVPVVSTDISGIPDLLDGVGLTVPPDDPAALASAIRAAAESTRAAEMADGGLRRISADYVVEGNAEKLLALVRGASSG